MSCIYITAHYEFVPVMGITLILFYIIYSVSLQWSSFMYFKYISINIIYVSSLLCDFFYFLVLGIELKSVLARRLAEALS